MLQTYTPEQASDGTFPHKKHCFRGIPVLHCKGWNKMPRKRLTQIFPWLLPLRRWQRKKLFYLKMRLDKNRYSKEMLKTALPYEAFSTSSLMINRRSGFDVKYQMNKVHNLMLAAKTLNGVVIRPGETFSFWQLVRYADKHERYKDGLNLIDGKIVGSYGGGLCQMSNMLFWMFLHTPLDITERHGHAVESFPSPDSGSPCGTDATVNEGWLDLKVKNNTAESYQIIIKFDEDYIYGWVMTDVKPKWSYEIFNGELRYYSKGGKIFEAASVDCRRTETESGRVKEYHLYNNSCEIGYELPEGIEVERMD